MPLFSIIMCYREFSQLVTCDGIVNWSEGLFGHVASIFLVCIRVWICIIQKSIKCGFRIWLKIFILLDLHRSLVKSSIILNDSFSSFLIPFWISINYTRFNSIRINFRPCLIILFISEYIRVSWSSCTLVRLMNKFKSQTILSFIGNSYSFKRSKHYAELSLLFIPHWDCLELGIFFI